MLRIYISMELIRIKTIGVWLNFMLLFQAPRPLSQSDLETVLVTSRKTKVAASEYTGLNSQSSGWSRSGESGDYPVQAAISELSRLVVSQILNIQTDAQDPS